MSWGSVISAVAPIIPQPVLVRATHAGVKFLKSGKIRVCGPGLHWYLPLTTEFETLPTVRQSANLPPQSLVTKDGKEVTLSLVITYEISNIAKALAGTWEVDNVVEEVGSGAATQSVSKREYQQLVDDLSTLLAEELQKSCRKLLGTFGVRVLRVHVTDFSPARVYRLIGTSPAVLPEDPDD